MDKKSPAQRIDWVDFAKGFVMILVVLGHAIEYRSDLYRFIYFFHMPFFFVMAGFLLKFSKWGGDYNYKNFVSKLVKRLLVPYYLANLFWYPIWFVVCHEMDFLKYLWHWTIAEPFTALLTIFIGTGNGRELILLQLWFLPALLVAEIIFIKLYNCFNKIGEEVFVMSLVACSLFGLFIVKITDLPLGVDIALVAQVLLFAGVLIRQFNIVEVMSLKVCVILILLLIFEFCINAMVNMNSRTYGDSFLFYSGGIAGTLLVMKFSMLLTKIGGIVCDFMNYCGRQSMIILVSHPIVANIFYEIIARNADFSPKEFFTEPIIIFGATMSGVLIPLIIAKKFGKLPVLKYFCA